MAPYQDGEQVASGRLERTGIGYEYTEVGRDAQSPVTDDYAEGDNTFTGKVKWIEMEGGSDTHDHLVDPAQIFNYHRRSRIAELVIKGVVRLF